MATSYEHLRKMTRGMAKRLAEKTDVAENTVMNVIMYAKNLTATDSPNVVDKVVFIAQLCKRFSMTSKIHIDIIFESLRLKGQNYVTLENYVEMICVFITNNLDLKIQYVFNCYDITKDGFLDYKEAHHLLLKSVLVSSEDQDSEEAVKELIDIVMNMADLNNDGMISLHEFSGHVHRDVLCLEMLGAVLPQDKCIREFVDSITDKTPNSVYNSFANERQVCLQEPVVAKVKSSPSLYTVRLELP